MLERKFQLGLSKQDSPRKIRDNLVTKVIVSATMFLSPKFIDKKECKEPNEDTMAKMLFSPISGFSSFC